MENRENPGFIEVKGTRRLRIKPGNTCAKILENSKLCPVVKNTKVFGVYKNKLLHTKNPGPSTGDTQALNTQLFLYGAYCCADIRVICLLFVDFFDGMYSRGMVLAPQFAGNLGET